MKNDKKGTQKPGIAYYMFRAYVRFLHDKIFYKKTYSINKESIPADGNPLMVVSNHQNCLNDPLGMLFSFRDRKPYVIARANVFEVHPLANKFLRSIGLLPAFRLDYEGESSLEKNNETFKMTEKALLDGNTIMMFPEAGHQERRWLGTFSFGYTKMAFEAAEMGNFEKDIQILPCGHHYSDYFGMQNQFMVRFGEPISLTPYYELYKTKPRTAQREVNKLVREQISNLMLNIKDLDNYDAIDFLRLTYGKELAAKKGLNQDVLPELLVAEKEVVAKLEQAQAENPEEVAAIYQDALLVKRGIKQLRIDDSLLSKAPSAFVTLLTIIGLILLFPLWVTSLWPSLLMYLIPMGIFKKLCTDVMFEGTFLFAVNALILMPLFTILTLVYAGLNACLLAGIIYVALFPLLIVFSWRYAMCVGKTWKKVNYLLAKGSDKMKALKSLRATLHAKLDKITSK